MLTDEQKRQIAEDVKATVNEAYDAAVKEKGKEVAKRFSPPGNDGEEIKIGNSPEDKIMADKKGGFKSFSHFLSELMDVADIHNPRVGDALAAYTNAMKAAGTMEEGIPSQGGYLVPVQFGEMIFQKALETAIVRPRAQYQPMTGNRIEINADVDKNHSANFFGGVQIYRTGESVQMTASNPTYERIALTLHIVSGLCHVTNELIEDSSMAVEADVTRKFSQAIAFVMDDDFLNGTGAKQPLGALNSANPALITVTAVAGQGANTIIAENIRDMWFRQANKSNAIWLANHDVFPQLFGMVLTVGTAGVPVWMPAGGVSNAPYETLMGRPLLYTEKCQTLGTAGDIALVDFKGYIVAGKGNQNAPTVATSIHLRFDYNEQSFRFTMRYDGQPLWTAPLTPKYSTSTLSPFVVLSGTRT